jgi:2,3-bisphosphoglycerate-independent phosphoglycerate mutase
VIGPAGRLTAIDPRLDTEGRPQSGTGQTALLTGVNAAARIGRHFGPWAPTDLRPLLRQESLFAKAKRLGESVAFANAYPSGHMSPGGRGVRRPGPFPLAADAADLLTRAESEVRNHAALVSSITTDGWRQYVDPLAPRIEAPRAGRLLAAIARDHRLTVFAHYDTDLAGHKRDMPLGKAAIERVDEFLGGILTDLPADFLLLMTSDHGNLEDATTGHTRNDVPLLAVGAGSALATDRIRSIQDVTPVILDLLGSPGRLPEKGSF